METACLRIKFTPLFQKSFKNNSKCCLEIVPEISCLQNLDKLIWKQETNCIEYNIPMTYKVILKKRQSIKDPKDEGDVKTYHSCVDLLLTSSKSTVDFASGDISKIISDTFIFNKPLENGTNKELLRNIFTDIHKNTETVCNYPISHKTTNTRVELSDMDTKEVTQNVQDHKVEVKTNIQPTFVNEMLHNALSHTMATIEEHLPIFDETIQSGSAVIHAVKSFSKDDFTRRLTLSPICSISTREAPFINKIVASKAVTCKIFESYKDLLLLGSISSPSDLSHDIQSHNVLPTVIDVPKEISSRKLNCRVPPEFKIAEYMRYIEKEILPLKLMLNDIKSKCTALGIKFTKKPHLVHRSVSTNSQEIIESCQTTKSNRVVFSIVFDG